MDDFDRAQELEMIARDRAIATQQRRFAELKTAPGAETALDCLECGEEIPEPRRQALPGIMRCIQCQQLQEDRMKKYATR